MATSWLKSSQGSLLHLFHPHECLKNITRTIKSLTEILSNVSSFDRQSCTQGTCHGENAMNTDNHTLNFEHYSFTTHSANISRTLSKILTKSENHSWTSCLKKAISCFTVVYSQMSSRIKWTQKILNTLSSAQHHWMKLD